MAKNPFSEEEIRYILRNYKRKQYREIADHLGRSKSSVNGVVQRLKLRKKKGKWSHHELEFVAENLGRMSLADMGRKLKRTATGVRMALKHHLPGNNQRSNIYSARAVAEVLGVR